MLDWSDGKHWGGGRTYPCRICDRATWLLDDDGRPCHMTCAEQEASSG